MISDEVKKLLDAVTEEKNRTPYLEIAQGGLRCVMEHLGNHEKELGRRAATEAEAIAQAEKELKERKAALAGRTTGGGE